MGGGGGGFRGFSSGGYTGDSPRTAVAGVVHGQEFVIPAGPTKKYRPLLEAMRRGRELPTVPVSGGGAMGGGQMNVTIQNYGSANVETRKLSDNEILILIDEKSKAAARSEAPKAVAGQLADPNSRVSKSFQRNTNSQRRR